MNEKKKAKSARADSKWLVLGQITIDTGTLLMIDPGMHDPSGALGQRILALETTRSWAGKEDRKLTDKLFAELPGILCWSLAGSARNFYYR